MAKGQQRSNREVKKPKKAKAAATADAPSPWTTLDKMQGKDAAGRKK